MDFGSRISSGLEREPAAASKIDKRTLRKQLAENGARPAEIEILLNERVELNAMSSGDLVAMIERKLNAYGLKKVVPDQATARGGLSRLPPLRGLAAKFEAIEEAYDAKAKDVAIPKDSCAEVRAILDKHRDLRWDDAVQIVLDKQGLERVRADKAKARKKAGDFTGDLIESFSQERQGQ